MSFIAPSALGRLNQIDQLGILGYHFGNGSLNSLFCFVKWQYVSQSQVVDVLCQAPAKASVTSLSSRPSKCLGLRSLVRTICF